MIETSRRIKVQVPTVPNFLYIDIVLTESEASLFASGRTATVSIATFSDEDLSEVGKQWTEKLIARAKEIRATPTPRGPQ